MVVFLRRPLPRINNCGIFKRRLFFKHPKNGNSFQRRVQKWGSFKNDFFPKTKNCDIFKKTFSKDEKEALI